MSTYKYSLKYQGNMQEDGDSIPGNTRWQPGGNIGLQIKLKFKLAGPCLEVNNF